MNCPVCSSPMEQKTSKAGQVYYSCSELGGRCRYKQKKDGTWYPDKTGRYPTAVFPASSGFNPAPAVANAGVTASQALKMAPPMRPLQQAMPGEEKGNLLKIVASMQPTDRLALAFDQAQLEGAPEPNTLFSEMVLAGRALSRISKQFDHPF